jgi:quercetin dioxygenase-like cupin family protein
LAAVLAWLGWLTVSPALGFPTLGPAAMLNRVFAPRSDPGSWLGWALLLIALGSAALLYLAAAERGRFRPSIASGAAYGAICWLVAGAVVMPLLGLAAPSPATTTPPALTPPDPMHGSFMMLHLGIGAPIAALVGWVMFGAVLGAMAGSRASIPWGRRLVAATGALALVAIALVVAGLSRTPAGLAPTSRTLATGPVDALPQGAVFFSIVDLPQAAGATLGPHAHVPGFAYSLAGVETLTFDDGRTVRVASGEAGFMGAQAAHAHLNADDRVAAAALALLILVLAGTVCLIARRPGPGERLLPITLVALIAAGALGMANPYSNDWLFLSVRPVAARGAPMPLPSASRSYESPDIGALPAGPYLETLEELTVLPGVPTDIVSAGAAALFVLDGRVDVQSAGGSPIQLADRGATIVQPGTAVRASNSGERPAHLLKFSVIPAPAGG